MEELRIIITSIWFTIVIVLAIMISAFVKKDKDLVTMLWIFWTFSWIIAGLYWFNTDDIYSSVPTLIDGLKTAFWTSIAGLFTSIILWHMEKEEDNKWEIDFLKVIKDEIIKSNDENKKSNKSIIEKLTELNKWIWWDWDNSLINQIKLLKSDWNENHRALKKSFDEFADKMSDNNIDALTEAIEKVMWEFNTIINEKLWKTFDDFKKSVEKLNIWQENYKENIISSTEALNLSKDSLEKSSKWFEITVEKSETFAWISEKLWWELKSLNDSLEIFKNWINEFDWVAKNTKEMANSMTESINSLTENFVSKAEIMVWESEKQITMMKDTFSEQSKDLKESHKNILDDLKQNVDNTNKNVSEQFEKIANELERQVSALDNNFREHYETFDEKLQEELTKSLSSLWRELTSVSEHFVWDYSKLAEKLESLINNK